MSIRALFLMLLGFSCVAGGADLAVEKVAVLRSVDVAYRKLVDLSDRCSKRNYEEEGSLSEQDVEIAVDRIVDEVKNPEALFRLAVASYVSAYPQEAGFQRVDSVFDAAWRASVQTLSSIGSEESLTALRSLSNLLRTDAGESLRLKQAIEKAERMPKRR